MPRLKTMIKHSHTPSTSIGKALLLEDDELVGLNIKTRLARAHVECDWFLDFKMAVEAFKNGAFHLVIADMFINTDSPEGLELIKLAKEGGIPSIIITSRLDIGIAKQGLNYGADFLLEKPLDTTMLVNIIKDIWNNPRGLIGLRERFLETQRLTQKEKEIACLILKGLSNQEVANVSGASLATVKFYTNQIFEKCAVKSRAEFFNTIFPT